MRIRAGEIGRSGGRQKPAAGRIGRPTDGGGSGSAGRHPVDVVREGGCHVSNRNGQYERFMSRAKSIRGWASTASLRLHEIDKRLGGRQQGDETNLSGRGTTSNASAVLVLDQ
jgi:hypothetical protein